LKRSGELGANPDAVRRVRTLGNVPRRPPSGTFCSLARLRERVSGEGPPVFGKSLDEDPEKIFLAAGMQRAGALEGQANDDLPGFFRIGSLGRLAPCRPGADLSARPA